MTPAQLFAELDRRGVRLVAEGGRLRFHPRSAVDADLLERIRECKAALLAELARRAELQWLWELTPADLPKPPWQLHPGQRVIGNEVFLGALKADALLGPESPRWRWGALQADIERVREVMRKRDAD
jgi:hypothetical protein